MFRRSLVVAGALVVGFVWGRISPQLPSMAGDAEPTAGVIHAGALFTGLQPVVPGLLSKTIFTNASGEVDVDSITSIRLHRHLHSREFLYVVSGTGTAHVANVVSNVGPGDLIVVPRAAPHAFTANGSLRVLEFDVPPVASNDVHWLN